MIFSSERHLDDLVDLGLMVETNPMVCAFWLGRAGLLRVGTEATIGAEEGHPGGNLASVSGGGKVFRLSVPEAGRVLLDGQEIRLVAHPMVAADIFSCPSCGNGVYRMHRVAGRWGCRRCQGLTYLSKHRGRTIPRLFRLRLLRRKIGASPILFSPLPRKPLYAREHLRACIEIRRLERGLIRHGRHDVARVLEQLYGRPRSRARRAGER